MVMHSRDSHPNWKKHCSLRRLNRPMVGSNTDLDWVWLYQQSRNKYINNTFADSKVNASPNKNQGDHLGVQSVECLSSSQIHNIQTGIWPLIFKSIKGLWCWVNLNKLWLKTTTFPWSWWKHAEESREAELVRAWEQTLAVLREPDCTY